MFELAKRLTAYIGRQGRIIDHDRHHSRARGQGSSPDAGDEAEAAQGQPEKDSTGEGEALKPLAGGEMADLEKFRAPARSGEVSGAVLETRLAMIQLFNMILALRAGNEADFSKAAETYLELDKRLQGTITEIGGLDAPSR